MPCTMKSSHKSSTACAPIKVLSNGCICVEQSRNIKRLPRFLTASSVKQTKEILKHLCLKETVQTLPSQLCFVFIVLSKEIFQTMFR